MFALFLLTILLRIIRYKITAVVFDNVVYAMAQDVPSRNLLIKKGSLRVIEDQCYRFTLVHWLVSHESHCDLFITLIVDQRHHVSG